MLADTEVDFREGDDTVWRLFSRAEVELGREALAGGDAGRGARAPSTGRSPIPRTWASASPAVRARRGRSGIAPGRSPRWIGATKPPSRSPPAKRARRSTTSRSISSPAAPLNADAGPPAPPARRRRFRRKRTRRRRASQHRLGRRRASHYRLGRRRASQHRLGRRRASHYRLGRRRASQHRLGRRRASQHRLGRRRASQHRLGRRRVRHYRLGRGGASHYRLGRRGGSRHRLSRRGASQRSARRRRAHRQRAVPAPGGALRRDPPEHPLGGRRARPRDRSPRTLRRGGSGALAARMGGDPAAPRDSVFLRADRRPPEPRTGALVRRARLAGEREPPLLPADAAHARRHARSVHPHPFAVPEPPRASRHRPRRTVRRVRRLPPGARPRRPDFPPRPPGVRGHRVRGAAGLPRLRGALSAPRYPRASCST